MHNRDYITLPPGLTATPEVVRLPVREPEVAPASQPAFAFLRRLVEEMGWNAGRAKLMAVLGTVAVMVALLATSLAPAGPAMSQLCHATRLGERPTLCALRATVVAKQLRAGLADSAATTGKDLRDWAEAAKHARGELYGEHEAAAAGLHAK